MQATLPCAALFIYAFLIEESSTPHISDQSSHFVPAIKPSGEIGETNEYEIGELLRNL